MFSHLSDEFGEFRDIDDFSFDEEFSLFNSAQNSFGNYRILNNMHVWTLALFVVLALNLI
jgi:hypothetical protein